MIVKSLYTIRSDNVRLFISYSDKNMKIIQDQTGNIYDSAVDVESASFTYTETDIPVEFPVDVVPPNNEDEIIEPQSALDAIFGGAE